MATRDEQEWFHKFYEGTFLVKGWKTRITELLEKVPPADREETRKKLAGLGEKIGWEWAKDNRSRKINNEMLQKWGESLSIARDRGHTVLNEEILRVDDEVSKLLSEK